MVSVALSIDPESTIATRLRSRSVGRFVGTLFLSRCKGRPASLGENGIILRGVNTAAQDIAIVALQRITPVQAMIARQFDGFLYGLDRVVRDGELHQIAFSRRKWLTAVR